MWRFQWPFRLAHFTASIYIGYWCIVQSWIDIQGILYDPPSDQSIPSTPSATSTFANQLTLRSSSFQFSSPTSTAYFSSTLTSPLSARRREGEDVMRSSDSSVSRLRDRVDRLEEPMNVRKGREGD